MNRIVSLASEFECYEEVNSLPLDSCQPLLGY